MEEYKNEFWKDNGFNTKEEYNQFMQKKIGELFKMIKDDPKLIAVFKRLANK
jgi:Txe/YoeB family toxin of Txe-Axe toxin-antitoxin module